MDLATGVLLVQALLKYGPQVATEIATLFKKKDAVTIDEWIAVFAKAKPYEYYVQATPFIPPGA